MQQLDGFNIKSEGVFKYTLRILFYASILKDCSDYFC